MKYRRLTCILLLALLLLCGCRREEPVTVYEKNGYTVDTAAQTITRGGDVITYTPATNGIQFTYPDGSSYTWNADYLTGTTSVDFDFDKWPDAWELMDVLDYDPGRSSNSGESPVLGFFAMVLGILQAIFPRAFWYVSHGWKYKDAEPSDMALFLGRAGGVLVALVGLFTMLL